MSKMNITDAVLTSICFITPARADFSLLISLVVSFSADYRAPRDSRMGSTGISSALGPAFGCSLVWTGGARTSVRLALHQISLSITKKYKEMTTK